MGNISTCIEWLKSPDKIKRCDACEQLRVRSVIPPEALDALRDATHDPDRDVADAAARALEVHGPHEAFLRAIASSPGDSGPPSQSPPWWLSPMFSAVVVLVELIVGSSCWPTDTAFWRTEVCQVLAGPAMGDLLGTWGFVILTALIAIPASTLLGFLAARSIKRLSDNIDHILPLAEIAIGILTPLLVVALAPH